MKKKNVDLVEGLRIAAKGQSYEWGGGAEDWLNGAADEIERLRAALTQISTGKLDDTLHAAQIARNALNEQKEVEK